MLRFIDIGSQITKDCRDFAWYDTVTDSFLEFNGSVVWDSWEDFVDDLTYDKPLNDKSGWLKYLKRFEGLAPKELVNAH